jgi:hypothetical protein
MTSLIHYLSCECTKNELDLFQVPLTQTSVVEGSWLRVKPIAAISQDAPHEYHVTAQSEDYIDPSQTQLLINLAGMVKPHEAIK